MRAIVPALTIVALAACSGREHPGPVPAPASPDWRAIATPADRDRIRRWRDAWVAALAQARAADPAAVAREGALFAPDLALADPGPPPGAYRCRVFKLGAKGTAMRGYTAYPAFECRITAGEGALLLQKLTGSQRPVGRILPAGSQRAVFLGTLVLGDEQGALRYGADRTRDMAGLVERIGQARWRLALPYPHFESLLDVIELVPAGSAGPG